MDISVVGEGDVDELLPLMRAYCDFYAVDPSDQDLTVLSRAWSWSTTSASRLAVMNDLYVTPEARGSGAAEALIGACADRAREHGASSLGWQTALDNERAQKVYDRVGGQSERWLDYSLQLRQ